MHKIKFYRPWNLRELARCKLSEGMLTFLIPFQPWILKFFNKKKNRWPILFSFTKTIKDKAPTPT